MSKPLDLFPSEPGVAVTYKNRKGIVYYLGKTEIAAGRVRLIFSRRVPESPVSKVPQGYKISESINGTVSLCKIASCPIKSEELEIVQQEIERHKHLSHYKAEAKGKAITIYEPDGLISIDTLKVISGNPALSLDSEFFREQLRQVRYNPVMCFVLLDGTRKFSARRMSYSGVGGWKLIASGVLANLARTLIHHIGMESFFTLSSGWE